MADRIRLTATKGRDEIHVGVAMVKNSNERFVFRHAQRGIAGGVYFPARDDLALKLRAKEEHQRNKFELARDEIGLAREDARERAERASEFALFALRSVFLLNGGAILALITILSAPHIDEDPKVAMLSAGWFSFGLISTIVSSGIFFLEAQIQSVTHREKADEKASLAQGIPHTGHVGIFQKSQIIRVVAFYFCMVALFFFAVGIGQLEGSLDTGNREFPADKNNLPSPFSRSHSAAPASPQKLGEQNKDPKEATEAVADGTGETEVKTGHANKGVLKSRPPQASTSQAKR